MTTIGNILKPRLSLFVLDVDGVYSDLKTKKLIYDFKKEKPEIKNKQYSMLPYVIFSIMITTVILLIMCFAINDNYITTELDNPIQCIMSTFKNIVFNEIYRATSSQFIDKYNKIKDLIINIAKHITIILKITKYNYFLHKGHLLIILSRYFINCPNASL